MVHCDATKSAKYLVLSPLQTSNTPLTRRRLSMMHNMLWRRMGHTGPTCTGYLTPRLGPNELGDGASFGCKTAIVPGAAAPFARPAQR